VSVSPEPAGAALPPLEELLTGSDVKACCTAVYGSPVVHWLMGGELHPGGEATTRRALELIEVGRGDRLLDVACGWGTSALLAARELGCEVVGVEYGDGVVSAARAAADAEGLGDSVSFRQGDAEALPFADGDFDAVLCECSLCTFQDKPRAIAEMLRVLRPSGRVALSDVVVERSGLPAELDGVLATIACVGDALSRRGYEELLAGAGLRLLATESRAKDAAALAGRIEDRLRGARLLGLDRVVAPTLPIEDAVELVWVARRAIADGAIGYAIFAAAR
jgi:arsenite methyltransferase